MFPKKIWISFIILVIAYGLVLQEGEGMQYLSESSRFVKHAVHLAFLLFFFGMGYWAWSGYKEKWILKIWKIIYAGIFIILGIGGLIDVISKIENLGVRYSFGYIRFFGTSPVPFALCMFFVKFKNILDSQKGLS